MLVAGPAFAQCAPDPTITNGTTTCTGTDGDGLTVATSNTRVVVAPGAVVRPGNGSAALLSTSSDVTFQIGGTVDGGNTKPGLFVSTGPATTGPCDPYAGASVGTSSCIPGTIVSISPFANATISVLQGGTLSGAQGLLFRPDASSPNGSIYATLSNAGTITGTNGPAIVANQMGFGSLSVTNATTGTIGGITGKIAYVTNAGTIDGGGNSAVATTLSGMNVANTGRIVSGSGSTTLSGTGYLYVTNAAGATIGGGATAIRTTGALSLSNAGTINGSVTSTAPAGQGSTIDTRAGTINGNVTLGAGDDTLRARYDAATGKISSITGTIDGGAGIDTIALGVDANTTFRSVVLPTNFERLGLDLSNNAVATLAPGFSTGTAIQLGGNGTLVNQAALVTTGQAINAGFASFGLAVTNQGSISATLSDTGSYAVGTPATLTNSGTISATGGGGVSVYGTLTNTGTISATGTGAAITSGTLVNTGTIRSTGGIGVSAYLSSASTNAGTITGATTGVALTSGRLTNSGSISGGTTGILLGYGTTFINAAGGTVAGGIASNGPTIVGNAGRITGNVNLAQASSFDSNNDVYIDNGGSVSGAIRLGGGDDQLVVDLATTAGRPLAGAIGGVDAGAGWDTIRYRVGADANATLALPNSFEGLAYEVSNGAALTLTTASPITTTIGLTGKGSVALNANVSITDRTLIDATIPSTDQLAGIATNVVPALSISNAGTLALTATTQNLYSTLSAINAGSADVTNTGTISVANATGRYYPANAIQGGTTVTNAGTINLVGAGTAISGARTIVNSGTITDTVGSNAVGVTGFTTLTNSGTIRTDGIAVQANSYYATASIANSGMIESRKAAAISLGYYGTKLVNEAAGIIRAATAIDASNGGLIVNRGAIVGNVTASPYAYSSVAYIADGGTLTGNLTFGQGYDFFLQKGDTTGVSGTIDGGNGFDTFGYSRSTSGSIALDKRPGINFEADYVEALGADTRVTLTATQRIGNAVYLQGDGTIINEAMIDGGASTYLSTGMSGVGQGNTLAAFINRGTIAGGMSGALSSLTNSGTLGSKTLAGNGVYQVLSTGTLAFDNSGTVLSSGVYDAVTLTGSDLAAISAGNSGTIDGGMAVSATFATQQTPSLLNLANTGTITAANGDALSVTAGSSYYTTNAAAVTLTNSGAITASGDRGSAASVQMIGSAASTYAIDNSGTIRATGNGGIVTYSYYPGSYYPGSYYPGSYYPGSVVTYKVTDPVAGLGLYTDPGVSGAIANTGTIEASGTRAVALLVSGTALNLTNSGTIRGGTGTTLDADDLFGQSNGITTLAGAIQTLGNNDDRIVNSGTIIGSVDLGRGNDRIENRGRIEGSVFLGDGDDTFVQAADAVLVGTVDGGAGTDSLVVDATRGGAVNGDQFINFERFSQIGNGTVAYSGSFRFDAIGLSGGTISVAAGQTLSSTGTTTIAGSDGAETVLNAGTIAGTIDLGAGNDRVVNTGTIGGSVLLGAGDDQFVEGPGSRVVGMVDGGTGDNLYTVQLAGDRSGIGRRVNFGRLSVEGNGTLALTLDQNFRSIGLAGTGLTLALNGFGVGTVTGSDAAETFAVDGDVAAANMGAGNDTLALGTTRATGLYMGGTGTDTLRFTASAPVTLAGVATGFERVALAGGALTVTGTLGTAGDAIAFADGNTTLAVANGSTLAGTISLGSGNDGLFLAAGSTLAGSVSGGAGTDTATLELAGNRTLASGILTDFEILGTQGNGTLTLSGSHRYDRIVADTDLAVAAGSSLTAPVVFGSGANRFTIAGTFTGSVDGGAGSDTIQLSGGTSAAPVAFSDVANVEALSMTGGFATVSGNASFGAVDMSGGRLVGLTGSMMRASQFVVRQGATFGSAGTVVGDIAVAGILSPGASPGTMTVNGNVSLAAGSTSLFEITPTVADQLRVNGSVAITSGATLKIVAEGQIRPGTSYDLIVASGGITGSYTTIDKAASLFGFIVQRADRIQLLGQFLGDASFSPQVARSIAYANTAIQVQPATSALFDALPSLLLASGASNPQAFARLTPEPYASATQLGVDQALTLADTARGPAFATTDRDDVHAFTFAQGLGQWHRLAGNGTTGTSTAQTSGYGFLGGIGVGNRAWTVGAFGGYLDSRQRIDALAANTRTDGFVAGIHGRYAVNGLYLAASVLYDGGDATTMRTLPNGVGASGRYGLHSWISDLSAGYAIPAGGDWVLTPKAGITYIRTTRDRAVETGGVFALTVARDRHVAGFADAGISLGRADTSDAAFRPYVGLGVRTQIEGRTATAVAGYAGAPLSLVATGAQRAQVVGTASAGLSYRMTSGLELFSTVEAQTGRNDHRESINSGVRLRF